eukprot:GHVU01029931.1.p1 GENE.GHVU01029931.1~~GHVU01029931.1.p1  ORF type:complete len:137 (-),score=0.65 GHVU01029931.1:331-741(-)
MMDVAALRRVRAVVAHLRYSATGVRPHLPASQPIHGSVRHCAPLPLLFCIRPSIHPSIPPSLHPSIPRSLSLSLSLSTLYPPFHRSTASRWTREAKGEAASAKVNKKTEPNRTRRARARRGLRSGYAECSMLNAEC